MNTQSFLECEFDVVCVGARSRGGSFSIRIFDHDRNCWCLTAVGVRHFALDEMCLQNVIEKITVVDAANLEPMLEAVRRKLFYLLQGRQGDTRRFAGLEGVIDGLVSDIRVSKAVLLEVEAIYGAYVLAFAAEVSLRQERVFAISADGRESAHPAVALVVEIETLGLLETLALSMPIWIADTPSHRAMSQPLVSRPDVAVTWFPLSNGESLEHAAMRIASSLDDHHNEYAQVCGYEKLLVIGAELQPSTPAALAPLGFVRVEPTAFGFIALKC